MHSQVVHHKADIVEGVAGPELIKPDLELLDVDCLLELEHEVDSSFERDASEHGYGFSSILPVVDLDLIPLSRPLMSRNGLGCYHGLVKVDDAEALIPHLLQPLAHEASLSQNASLSARIIKFGDPNLLLPDVVPPVDGSVGGDGDLLIWVPS